MEKITWQRWVTVCVVLVLLGLAADYYYLHFLFNQKQKNLIEETAPAESQESQADSASQTEMPTASAPVLGQNNFLDSLKACRPDISAQGVTTPEALLTYLEKSIGVESSELGGNTFAAQDPNKANINPNLMNLKDGSTLNVDARGSDVLGFELKTEERTLICKASNCLCQ